MTMLRATARLQLHKDFTLDDAAALVDYYAALGISHLYASPMLVARAGSSHGYDVVDPTRLNPELGGEAALRRLVARLRAAGMGLIADIVPNHMGVGAENPWWQHVLEWGSASPYARWFDIDWEANDPALRGKLLAPFLGQPYGEALEAGHLRLQFDPDSGKIFACYYGNRFPLAPASYADVLRAAGCASLQPALAAFEACEQIGCGEPGSARQACVEAAFMLLRDIAATPQGAADIETALAAFSADTPPGRTALHHLLERQHYRLTWWRNAAEEMNWRRFFEVSDLAGVRVEQDEVFEATHQFIFRLYAQGLIDGVRIDHVDGLADPGGYCRKLRQRLVELSPQRPPELGATPPYLFVEKILAADEQLPADWQVDGTTGYEFMDQVGALLHDPAGAAPLAALWTEVTGDATGFEEEVRSARRQLLAQNFVGEFDAAARALHAVARADLRTQDFSLGAIRRVLTELLAHFPVYRTYADEHGRGAQDRTVFEQASHNARRSLRAADRPMLDMIGAWLGGAAPRDMDNAQVAQRCLRAITRFQQLTPPLAAKSVEDTAFYRYGRLLSRNEVGADPARFSISVQDFHRANSERARLFPNSLLATATHDHKRGEDVRMRLAVLSEMPQRWEQVVRRWMALNTPLRSRVADDCDVQTIAPQSADELMLYQMLVGAWPVDLLETDHDGVHAFAQRIDQWQTKALREAKRLSSWALPHERYEAACRDFLFGILHNEQNTTFLKELVAWVRHIEPLGVVNSLTHTVLRMTSPGVPDLYQGTEFWDFSLVDPDNRRAVDYEARRRALLDTDAVGISPDAWRGGYLKQQLIRRALGLRAQEAALFAHGAYVPLAIEGPLSANVIAYLRRYQGRAVLTIATRFAAHLVQGAIPTVPAKMWENTVVVMPESSQSTWSDIFTRKQTESQSGRLRLADVLSVLPVALLHAPLDSNKDS
jgi:(1->4)-alpha-D-glucan 1-alpha-D-glucosylmutase